MGIVHAFWEFGVTLLCAIIQLIGVTVQGIVRVLAQIVALLDKAHKGVSGWGPNQRRGKRERVDTPQ